MDSRTLRANPELFKIILLNAVEEIAAGTRDESETPIKQQDRSLFQKQEDSFKAGFKKGVSQLIDGAWNELSNKIAYIHQLESMNAPDYVAWRPTTGEIPHLCLKGNNLMEQKERLLFKFEKHKKEGDELKTELITRATKINESLNNINNAEKCLANLCEEYEKITEQNS